MTFTGRIAKHLREIHFGGNWTSANLKDKLGGRHLATSHNASLFLSYNRDSRLSHELLCERDLKVLQGGPLDAKDKYSFDHPPILSHEDWERLLEKTWTDAENLAGLIEQMPESRLWENFVDEKYGNYYRCLHGPIEHCHYHLGQIALIKTILSTDTIS